MLTSESATRMWMSLPRDGRINGKQRQRETQEAVGSHFQQDASEDHADGCGRLGISVWQPGVEREHRCLDGEGEEKSPEEPDFQRVRKILRSSQQRGDVEGSRGLRRQRLCIVEIERQDREQHDDRARQGIEEKFDGCVQAAVAAPTGGREEHGNKHHFPENVEEEEIERGKRRGCRSAAEAAECNIPWCAAGPRPRTKKMAIMPRNVVSITRSRLMPSTPSE